MDTQKVLTDTGNMEIGNIGILHGDCVTRYNDNMHSDKISTRIYFQNNYSN